MPSGTHFDPPNSNFFDKTKLNKDAKGVAATASAGTITNIDLTLTDDILLAGGTTVLAKGAAQGDYVDFQVIFGSTVVATFVSNWYVNPDSTLQAVPPSNYPAKIPAGFILRLVYHSVGGNSVWVAINYNLEKVLE